MSAEKSHEWLIDALYPEHDEQPDHPASPEHTSGELEDQELLASYDAMLSELREGIVMHAPRSEVSDSIRAAARKQAEVFATDQARISHPSRRSAPGQATAAQSFWSRAKKQGALQLVAVLAVCLGAGLLVRTMSFTQAEPESFSVASSEGAAEKNSFAQQDAPSPSPAIEEEAEVADNDFEDYDYNRRSAAEEPESSPDALTLALKEQDTKEQGARRRIDEQPNRGARPEPTTRSAKRSQNSAPAKAPTTFGASDDLMMDSLAKTSEERAEKQDKKTYRSSSSDLSSVFGGQEDVAQEQKMAQAPITSGKRDAMGNSMGPPTPDNVKRGSAKDSKQLALADDESEEAKPVQPAPQATSDFYAPAESAPSSASGSATTAKKPAAPSTLADAERAYKKNDYEQTLQDADAYIARGIGSNQERARALELKAQALDKLGRGGESTGIYEEIREKYPDYYRKENLQSKKKQRKAAPKSKMETDFDGMNELQSY